MRLAKTIKAPTPSEGQLKRMRELMAEMPSTRAVDAYVMTYVGQSLRATNTLSCDDIAVMLTGMARREEIRTNGSAA